jgi:RimJ/RimL family protein N-acetyltransferase
LKLAYEALGAEHADALFPAFSDARVWAFIDGNDGKCIDEMRAEYARRRAGSPRAEERWLNFAVRADDAIVGRIEATEYREGWAEVACVLAVDAWGKGIAQQAMRWLFSHLAVREVWASVHPSNAASLKLFLRLGFLETGMARALASADPGDIVLSAMLPSPPS